MSVGAHRGTNHGASCQPPVCIAKQSKCQWRKAGANRRFVLQSNRTPAAYGGGVLLSQSSACSQLDGIIIINAKKDIDFALYYPCIHLARSRIFICGEQSSILSMGLEHLQIFGLVCDWSV